MFEETGIKAKVIEEIRELAIVYGIDKVVLFGSRARGDFRERSDIDLAVWGGDYSRFALSMADTSTLLSFDVVNMDQPIQVELMTSIEKEGRVLYEKI